MNRLVNLAVAVFTIFAIMLTFGICWIIMGALRVPDVYAFIASMMYSAIPIYLFIRDEIEEKQNVLLPQDSDRHSTCPVIESPVSTVRKRGRQSGRNKSSGVQSGGIDPSNAESQPG